MALSKPGTAKLGSVYEKELVDSVKAILENKVDGMGALTKMECHPEDSLGAPYPLQADCEAHRAYGASQKSRGVGCQPP